MEESSKTLLRLCNSWVCWSNTSRDPNGCRLRLQFRTQDSICICEHEFRVIRLCSWRAGAVKASKEDVLQLYAAKWRRNIRQACAAIAEVLQVGARPGILLPYLTVKTYVERSHYTLQ